MFAEHRRALQAFLYRRIRTKSDAPDLAQEVHVRMLRVSDIHAIRDPERYLVTVASNLVKEYAVPDRRSTPIPGRSGADPSVTDGDPPSLNIAPADTDVATYRLLGRSYFLELRYEVE